MNTVAFGRTDIRISPVGLGGEGVLRTFGRLTDARAVIREAVDLGITYFDSARVYADSEVYYGSIWKEEPSLRRKIFQTSKSASRNREGARADLESSLQRLHTDYLDLWQIHDVRTTEDLAAISGPGGALEAFMAARDEGLVRHIGVTGHHDPAILTRAVAEWPVDAVLLPVNPVEGVLDGFLTQTLSAARRKGIAVIGMKVLGAGHYVQPGMHVTAEILIRYAMRFDITLPVVGCASPAEVQVVAETAQMKPLADFESKALENTFRSNAPRLAFYRGAF